MATPVVSSPHILNVGTSWYDLRKVVSWTDAPSPTSAGPATSVSVTFQGMDPSVRILMDKDAFLTAKVASLAAGG